MASDVTLRDMRDDDLPLFFAQQLDPDANFMAAFTVKDPTDRDAFMAHWARNRADKSNIHRTILADGQVAGNIVCYEEAGEPEMSYWLGREFWGKGIATKALAAFLQQLPRRPLFARVAKDNADSRRVLEKCGFRIVGAGSGYANARGAITEEYILRLDTPADEVAS